ncbi:MAG TPA: hypothetical protein DDY78_24400 [Planctomycetales bacterium]|jgi:beta-lactamase regulating signal transducer with metallopeptidase domain|nr:hypothetical protein [Planctomycetales bacterium]
METLLRIGLSNAVVALVMALVVVTVACVWRRPAVLHALWLLVLVKLVTPPLVWVRVPWPIIPDAPAVAVARAAEPAPIEPLPEENTVFVPDSEAMRETPSVEVSNELAVSETLPDALTPLEPLAIPNTQNTTLVLVPGWMAVTCGVWLAGAFAWYALALVRLRRFRQMLRHAVPAPESLRQRTQRLAEKLRLQRCPGVWLVPGRVAPMLWAVGGRPRILFPADLLKQVGREQQNALLVHELAHLRRRDHWVRWLEFAAAGLYWWNPVLWFARRELREAEEQCCDAWVTSTLPGAGKTYATALLETLDFLSDAPPAMPLLASGVGRVVDLKRRLTMIMRGTTPRTLGWRGAAAVVGLGALLLPMLPAWVQAQPAPKIEAKEVQLRGDVKVVAPEALAEEAEKDGAELARLRADLAQKQAEVAALTARIAAIMARAKRPHDQPAAKAADAEVASYDVVIKVNGDAPYIALQDFLKQIQAVPVQGASPTVIFLDKYSGKVLMKMAMNPTPTAGAQPIGSPPTDTDKRIIDLEGKLKSILNEVEQLRRERKPAAPKAIDSESKPHSYGPTPLEKVPSINGQVKTEGPGTAEKAQAEARRMMKKLEAEINDVHERRGNLYSQLAKARELRQEQTSLRANADAMVRQAEAELKASDDDAEMADARAQQDNNPVTVLLLKRAKKRVTESQVNLERAKMAQVKVLADLKSNEGHVQAELKRAEGSAAVREAADAEFIRLREEYIKQEKASKAGDPPAKP